MPNESSTLRRDLWLMDERYQTVLRATKTIAFEFNPQTHKQHVSPFIQEYIAGCYDGRLLSDVMVQDDVIHPEDLELSLRLRSQLRDGQAHDMTLRLKTPEGPYRWFKMHLCPHEEDGQLLFVGTITDVEEEVNQRELLRYQAQYDSTTGIYNKDSFFTATQEWLRRQPDMERCLLRLDIDRFKLINELYGTARGDDVLQHLAGILRALAKPSETYARLANDVFCMCAARPPEEMGTLIDEIGRRLSSYALDYFQFVLSVGIVRIPKGESQPIHILCDRAAMAQRIVKGNFINRYAFFKEEMSRALAKEHHITSCMRQALEEKQFLIYLQPKFDMCRNVIIGAEALVRWKHPQDGMISPGDFIPLFERNGFILRLDEYIWELACKTLRRWLDDGKTALPVSVNVSRLHLNDPLFCEKLWKLTQKYRLPAKLLELEITESAYTENHQSLYNAMDKLQEMGFSFSMDDFGSGYSSLNVLKDIPVDLVKIDLNFLRKARRGEEAGRGILRGTVQLVQGMNLPIIAEGVETEEQAQFLMSVGCTCAQGYYYARPMPVEDFEKLAFPQRQG